MPEYRPNVADESHPLVGQTLTYQPGMPPYDPALDTEPGMLLVGGGMEVQVLKVFPEWNGYPDLTIAYVWVPETGQHAHISVRAFAFPMIVPCA